MEFIIDVSNTRIANCHYIILMLKIMVLINIIIIKYSATKRVPQHFCCVV